MVGLPGKFRLSKNGKDPPAGGVLRAKFHDFDQFADALVSWDVSLLQLDAGEFRAELFQLLLPESMLMSCAMSRGVRQQGGLPPGARSFGIPMKGCTPFVWRGHEVADDVMMIFPGGGELDSRSSADFRVVTLSVREDLLERLAEREGLGWILNEGARVVRPAAEKLDRLRRMAAELMHRSRTDEMAVHDVDFRQAVEVELPQLALELLADGQEQQTRPMARERGRVLRVALDHIEQRVVEPVQISEIVEVAECSSRTLRYAFEEKFGVSPKMYLKARRLTELKRMLKAADAKGSVGAVAAQMGFTHMGQLAGDYRRMFGELPSRTLGR